ITILVLIWSLAAGAFAAELSVQRSSAGGVTVAVTPQDVSGKSKTWSFNVVLDTHTQDLSDDLLRTAALFDDNGGKYDPVAWEGAGPGGHHRTGTLTFKAVSPYPQVLELRVQRTGETSPRTFRWQLQ